MCAVWGLGVWICAGNDLGAERSTKDRDQQKVDPNTLDRVSGSTLNTEKPPQS